MKTLRALLEGVPSEHYEKLCARDLALEIRNVTSDSREVRPHSLFVAVRGSARDGSQFIETAQEQGAVVIVGEGQAPENLRVPYLRVSDARQALAALAANFFGNPSHSLLMLAVTGTSGKTTTTYVLESILKACGHRVGVIGTVNFRFGERIFPSTHTTPGAVELQRLLAEMKSAGCTAVVMEVSSHALKQHRTAFIAFDGMIFTNLSPEHLDFHPDMEDYFRAKALLFTDMVATAIAAGKKPVAAINAQDEYGARLLRDLKAKPVQGFKFKSYSLDAQSVQVDLSGIKGKAGAVEIDSALAGTFNAYNIFGAVTLASALGLEAEFAAEGVRSLLSVPGRLEKVPSQSGIHVFVDYAHKPDALQKVLKTLAEVKGGHRLITVFGCGGDRDRKKRPVMGRISLELSDYVWVTSDNPRTEDPLFIIEEIKSGMSDQARFEVEPDRKKAIFGAIGMAKPGDIVLIAGKGHEDYQIVADPGSPGGTWKVQFDDRVVAADALAQALDIAF